MRIEGKIPSHLETLAKRLDLQIKALEQKNNIKSFFDKDEQKALQLLGQEKYLAYLKRTRQSLSQPDSPSEE